MRKRLLVVEDDPSTRRLLEYLLMSHYQVTSVTNGLEASKWLEEGNSADLIITDIEMPQMSGLELISNLNDKPKFSGIPVIVISSREKERLRQELEDFKIDAFLEKPVKPNTLFWRVEKSLGQVMAL